jgi:hypothetical protein
MQPFSIRAAVEKDLESLLALEEECWSESTRIDGDTIRQNLLSHPNNDFVIESTATKDILAVIYTQRIDAMTCIDDDCESVYQCDNIRASSGTIIQLLRVNSSSYYQGAMVGTPIAAGALLRDFILSLAEELGVKTVCAVTRCTDFQLENNDSDDTLAITERYLKYVNEHADGTLHCDNGLNFHLIKGARIVSCVKGWRPNDDCNLGYGVLVEYSISPDGSKQTSPSLALRKRFSTIVDIEQELLKLVKNILKLHDDPHVDIPLMTLGFDSLLLTPLVKELGMFYKSLSLSLLLPLLC